jgi:hypothetical protein
MSIYLSVVSQAKVCGLNQTMKMFEYMETSRSAEKGKKKKVRSSLLKYPDRAFSSLEISHSGVGGKIYQRTVLV